MARQRTPPVDAAQRIRRLEEEVAGLRRGMRTRGLIEQAKGRLVERLGLDPEAAFRYLSQRSQQTNVPVVDLAADVVGVDPAAGLPTEGMEPAEARRIVRLRSGLDAATEADDLVAALAEESGLDAAGLAVFAVEADGGLALVAARGWPDRLVSDWRWVPSAVRTPAAEAVRSGTDWWSEEDAAADDLVLIGPGRYRAALPVAVRGQVVAVLEVAWSSRPEPGVRVALAAAAGAVGDWLARAERRAESVHSGGDARWVEAVLEAVGQPAAVLTPLWSDEPEIEDFRVDWVNPAAGAGLAVGRRLLDLEPSRLHDGTFDVLVRTYHGRAGDRDDAPAGVTAARVGRRVVATWPTATWPTATWPSAPRPGAAWPAAASPPATRPSDARPAGDGHTLDGAAGVGGTGGTGGVAEAADDVRTLAMEELGPFGWGEWTTAAEPLVCSAGLYRLLGRRPERGPLRLHQVLAAIVPEDRRRAESTVDSARQRGERATLDVALAREDGPRAVRLLLLPRLDHEGRTRTLRILFHDRTDERRGALAAANTAERLATQRVQAAVERAQVERLRQAFLPPLSTERHHGPLWAVGRHAAPNGLHTFRGDFYDIHPADGRLLIAVGDVFGSGLAAAQTMVRLRHTARMLAVAGQGPADVLAALNRDFCTDDQPPLASLVLAEIAADGRSVAWAQAGHYSPILVHDGRARAVRRPRGDLLGLSPTTQYGRGTIQLGPGDLLVCFTDGVFQHWGGSEAPVRRLAAECEEAQRDGGLAALLQRVLPPAEDEACLVALAWPTAS